MADNFEDLGFAKLDMSRRERTGVPETIYCAGKTKEQLVEIFKAFKSKNSPVLGTRCSAEQADFVRAAGLNVKYDAMSRTIVLQAGQLPRLNGRIAVCTGGTADLPVAGEAAAVAEFFGAEVDRHFDVGVAGIHRLFARLEEIRPADVAIAVAGMEGALAGVVAGLVEAPVIAVPTSVGYGASFGGLAALLTMLNSCAEGVSVVNIDNGFGAAALACRILRRTQKHD